MIIRPYNTQMLIDAKDTTMAIETSQSWESTSMKMPDLLKKLKSSDLLHRDGRGQIRDEQGRLPDHFPGRGIYVFYENCKPLYVGRSGKKGGNPDRMRERIYEHCQKSSTHNSASFAFLLAVEKAKKQGIDCNSLTRDALQNEPRFKKIYDKEKKRVRAMGVRVVEVDDSIEQTIFEVYAALRLGTTVQQGGYNDFDNH